jgi:hypothetical protein
MDERGTDRGATSPGSGRPAGQPTPGDASARDARGKGSGSGRPQGGQGRSQGGQSRTQGRPQSGARGQGGGSGRGQGGGSGRPQGGGSGRAQGGGSGRAQGGGSGRSQGSGRPQGGAARPAKKTTGSARKAAARKRQERRRRAIVASVVAGVVVIAVVAIALVANRQGGSNPATAGYGKVTTFSGLSRNHTNSPVRYAQTPPVGGDHNPVWQNCGYYPQPVQNEHAVHDLEHGAVWITYQPNLPKAQVDALANMARSQQFTLVSPYPGLPAPVVASGWGVQEWFHSAGDAGLTQFVDKYRQGPQTPEPGALCTNGTGTPQ